MVATMIRRNIVETVKEGNVLAYDGAWGTFLIREGWRPGECPELWSLEHPEAVLNVAEGYVEAGSDLIGTNSFGGSSFKLERYGLEERVGEINKASAMLSREAAGEHKWVLGSIGPSGKMTVIGEVSEEDFYRAFGDQAEALAEGGADGICVESMSALDEACAAVKAAKDRTGLVVVASFTFEPTVQGEFRTMMGVSPTEAARAARDAGADILSTNCGKGYENMEQVLSEMREAVSDAPLMIYPNAGIPENRNGEDVFPATPEDMAAQVPLWKKMGASIIGGCCGTTPDHIRAIKTAINNG